MNTFELSASRSKVKRAQRHIAELESNTEAYFESVWYCLDYGSDDPDNVKTIHLTIKGRPAAYSEIVGDIIHNLRAALDLMAVEAVKANEMSPKGVMFPFAEGASHLDDQIRRKNFHRAPTEAIVELRRLQPYRGGNDDLRSLHDLDIEDKHRALIPAATSVTSPPISVLVDELGKPVGFDEGALRLTVDTSILPVIVHVFPEDFPFAGQPIIPTLHKLVELVSGILDSFEVILS